MIDMAKQGININLLTHRLPTHVYRTDASEQGMGGYSADGIAWRFQIPVKLRGFLHINFLEFIAAFVGPWLDHTRGHLPKFAAILAQTDNTCANGWMSKSNAKNSSGKQNKAGLRRIARTYAEFCLENEYQIVSNWIPGKENDVADVLSRDFQFDDVDICKFLHLYLPQQMPRKFKLVPLPKEISSWVILQLQKGSEGAGCSLSPKISTTASSVGGTNFSKAWATAMTHGLTTKLPNQDALLSVPLHKPCAMENFRKKGTKEWAQAQLEIP